MTAADWEEGLDGLYDAHERVLTDSDARGPSLLVVTQLPSRRWHVRQVLHDDAGDHDWSLTAEVDLTLCDEVGDLVLVTTSLSETGFETSGAG